MIPPPRGRQGGGGVSGGPGGSSPKSPAEGAPPRVAVRGSRAAGELRAIPPGSPGDSGVTSSEVPPGTSGKGRKIPWRMSNDAIFYL